MSNRSLNTAARDLRSDLRSAADLREVSLVRSLDDEFVASGGKIVYALDSAILNYLFSRRPIGQNSQKDVSLADAAYQIFSGPSGEPRLPAALKRAQGNLHQTLLWYLVDGRVPSGKRDFHHLILLPGHTTEVRKLYDDIVRDFHRQNDRFARLKDIANRFRALLTVDDRAERSADLLAELQDLHREMEEPHRKFSRINNLIQRRQILSLSAAAGLSIYDDDRLKVAGQNAFQRAANNPVIADEANRPGSLSWWANQLHGKLPPVYAAIDRIALSTLDQLNRDLDPGRARIVLFTDNTAIIDSGQTYRPFKGSEAFDQYQALSFSDLYLRHPKSLLVDPDFVRNSAEDTGDLTSDSAEVTGWLDALLDATLEKPSGSTHFDGKDLNAGESEASDDAARQVGVRQLSAFRAGKPKLSAKINDMDRIQAAVRSNRRLHQRFANRWIDYLSRLSDSAATASPLTKDDVGEVFFLSRAASPDETTRFDQLVGEVRARAQYLTEVSWSTFFNTAADTGLELINLPRSDQPAPVYPVPPLFLRGGEPGLREAIEAFWHPTKLRRDPTQVLKQLSESDGKIALRSSYVHALCYGLLFAFAERWSLTKLLAERAIRIAREIELTGEEASDPNPDRITGREAYFLLAVTCRVTARTREHYVQARSAIAAARRCREDPGDGKSAVRTPLSGVRFEAESIAIAMAEMVSAARNEYKAADHARAAELRDRILKALAQAGECGVPEIRRQSRIALRSEYFLSFILPLSAHGKSATSISITQHLVTEQLSDMGKVFGSASQVPLRDRALLRLAVATMGELGALPAALQQSTLAAFDRLDVPGNAQGADRRRLGRIEKVVEERLAALARDSAGAAA